MRIECTPEELIRLSMLLSGQAKANDHAGVEWLISSARPPMKTDQKNRSRGQEEKFRPRGDFGPTLRRLRTKAGLSVRELCELSGVSSRSIFLWETGKTPPSNMKKVEGVATALGVDLSFFEASHAGEPSPASSEKSEEPLSAPESAVDLVVDRPIESMVPLQPAFREDEGAMGRQENKAEEKMAAPAVLWSEKQAGGGTITGRLRPGEAGILEKRCSRCKTWYPADHVFFFANKGSVGSVTDYCKACSRERRRKIVVTFDSPERPESVSTPSLNRESSVSVEDLLKRRKKALLCNSLGEVRIYDEIIQAHKHLEYPSVAV